MIVTIYEVVGCLTMYINFWYPICMSDELPADKPVRAEVLGLRFAAFRDQDGMAHVLADTCAHRGGSLGKGQVRDGCLACPYHGWQYSGDGQCRKIPVLEGRKPPARAKVDSYPVVEKYGIVFAFLGDLPEEDRPPLYEIAQYGHADWRISEIMIVRVGAYYQRSLENGLDPVHNEFVHPLQGAPSVSLDSLENSDMPWGSKVYAHMGQPEEGKTRMADLRGDPKDLGAGSWHHGPNILVTSIDLSAENNLTQVFFEAPIDESHTKIYFINLRNCMLDPAMDSKMREVNLSIVNEDVAVLENLLPIRTPENATHEILAAGDECIVRYRNWLKEWQDLGWRIDSKAVRESFGDVAYAIPCPDRRTSGNWVLDTIPLVPPDL
jgi:phenylpropionate dioxygenase-like ring-hydroxylating dioxygenase large terminal subunit